MQSSKAVEKPMRKACTTDQLRDGVSDELAGAAKSKKKSVKEKKKKTKVVAKPVETAGFAKEEAKAEEGKVLEINKPAAANHVEISDNTVLKKLLRGPRYFDPPDSGWQKCYNCGEGGHTTANCSSVKRKKPCFVCGSFEHNAKQCKKGRGCFICEGGDHLAKNCPEKYKRVSQNSKLCLKCGDFCHDMFSCKNDYSHNDLKEIQCYICNSFGHLCCATVGDIGSREPSCYRCGQLGHTGLECQRSRSEPTSAGPLKSCFKCGEKGHFAQECSSSTKVHKRNLDTTTPTLKLLQECQRSRSEPSIAGPLKSCFKCGEKGHFAQECSSSTKVHKKNLDTPTPTLKICKGKRETARGFRSTPSDKSQKRKMTQFEGGRFSTPSKEKRSGGWITEYTGDLQRGYAQLPVWGSPVIQDYNRNMMYSQVSHGHVPSSYSNLTRAQELHFRPSASNVSPIFYQNMRSPSVDGNFSGYGMRSNYYW